MKIKFSLGAGGGALTYVSRESVIRKVWSSLWLYLLLLPRYMGRSKLNLNPFDICDQFSSKVQNLRQHNQQQSEAFCLIILTLDQYTKAAYQ